MEQEFLDFVSKVGVMKPAVINEESDKQKSRLEEIMMSDDYAGERKVDGCHYMIFGCRFFSTEGCEKTDNYPHLRDFFMSLQMPNIILDGEINYPNRTSQFCTRVTGASSNQAINFQEESGYIHYTMWDILRTPKGTWILNKTYAERRKMLEEFYNRFIKGTSLASFIHLTERRLRDKKAFYEDIINAGGEGMVLKKLDSFYIMGKNPMWQWMKVKQKDTADFYISGYEPAKVQYTGKGLEDWPYWDDVDGDMIPVTKFYHFNWIGSLELSAFVKGKATVICTCSGFDEDTRAMFSNNKAAFLNRVVKISFMEKTEANYPRHPRYEGLHESKLSGECVWDLNKEG